MWAAKEIKMKKEVKKFKLGKVKVSDLAFPPGEDLPARTSGMPLGTGVTAIPIFC